MRYEQYKQARTAQECFKRGGSKGDLKYDLAHGFVIVGNKSAVTSSPATTQQDKSLPDTEHGRHFLQVLVLYQKRRMSPIRLRRRARNVHVNVSSRTSLTRERALLTVDGV